MEHYTPTERHPRTGVVILAGGKVYPAEQQAPDGDCRKRATRYLKDGIWSEWCKDDHDAFRPWDLSAILATYQECAEWSSTADDDGTMFDDMEHEGWTDEATASSIGDIQGFLQTCAADLWEMAPGSIGHDFWLTRNGHGAGFWDRGLGERGARLTAACKPYGEVNLYLTDDRHIALA